MLDFQCALRLPIFTSEVSFGMNDCNLKERLKKLMIKDSWVRMLAEVAMTLTSIHTEELEPISAEKSLL